MLALLSLSLAALASAEPSTRYGIVFDAGSSGTRIHVHTYKTSAENSFELISDEIVKKKGGLSTFKNRTAEAGSSLGTLLDFARSKIPPEQQAATPMFLMATAGLRMVGEQAKDEILRSVDATLSGSGFRYSCGWSTVLDGRDEGLYGWVTVNFLLKTLYPATEGVLAPVNQPAPSTVGTIDLGGGSVQIVYATPEHGTPAGYAQTLDFGGRKHHVYLKSHLGFGLDAARTAALDQLLARKPSGGERPMRHPCVPKGAPVGHKGLLLTGHPDWMRCRKLMLSLFDRGGCPHASCSWGKAYQPAALPQTLYGFSYLYDRTAAIGLFDGKPAKYGATTKTLADINRAGAALCTLDTAALAERFGGHPDEDKRHNFCGDVAYVSALLESFGFAESQPLTLTNKIDSVELVWTLGAMLAKAADLAAGGSGGGERCGLSLARAVPQWAQAGLALLLAGVGFYGCTARSARSSHRAVSQPLAQSDS